MYVYTRTREGGRGGGGLSEGALGCTIPISAVRVTGETVVATPRIQLCTVVVVVV